MHFKSSYIKNNPSQSIQNPTTSYGNTIQLKHMFGQLCCSFTTTTTVRVPIHELLSICYSSLTSQSLCFKSSSLTFYTFELPRLVSLSAPSVSHTRTCNGSHKKPNPCPVSSLLTLKLPVS